MNSRILVFSLRWGWSGFAAPEQGKRGGLGFTQRRTENESEEVVWVSCNSGRGKRGIGVELTQRRMG